MDEAFKILKEIQKTGLKPIYFLMGEEPYFIDKISNYIEKNTLSESEKEFDRTVVYGEDTDIRDIITMANRYPLVAERQVVIVKEAQKLAKNIDRLSVYAENIVSTTTLVFCYKYKTIDKRKTLYKNLQKTGVVFESKKLYEQETFRWINYYVISLGYRIDTPTTYLLIESLGSDISKIEHALEKLFLVLPENGEITPDIVEKYIGINKSYNNFELRRALSEDNVQKVYQICQYFSQNPKENPIVVTLVHLYNFFLQVLKYHGLTDKNSSNVSKILKINPFFVKEINQAAKLYSMKQTSGIIETIHSIDNKSKGVETVPITQADLLKELIFNILIRRG